MMNHRFTPMNTDKMRMRILLSSALLFFTSCAGASHHSTTGPVTTGPADVRLSDAINLEQLETDDTQVNLTDKLDLPTADDPIYFGEADDFDSDDSTTPVAAIPLIAIHIGTQWKGVILSGQGLEDAGWKYVGIGPALREVWGVLDTAAGDSGPDFVLAHSMDSAQTFSLKVFRKPCRLASVADFAMSRAGKGRITLSLDTDCGAHKAGLYHYETIDGGKSWSKVPRYEPDAMIRSDTVPDGEQPQPPDKPMRTLWFRSSR